MEHFNSNYKGIFSIRVSMPVFDSSFKPRETPALQSKYTSFWKVSFKQITRTLFTMKIFGLLLRDHMTSRRMYLPDNNNAIIHELEVLKDMIQFKI